MQQTKLDNPSKTPGRPGALDPKREAADAEVVSHARAAHLTPVPSEGKRRAGRTIIDVIVELGFALPHQAGDAISTAREQGRAPEQILLHKGVINADQLARATAERYGYPYMELGAHDIDMAAANLLPPDAAKRYRAVPVAFSGDDLIVATADPGNVLAVDDIALITGRDCDVVVAAEADIDALIGRLSNLESAVAEAVEADEGEEEDAAIDLANLQHSADDAPIVKLVNSVLAQAVEVGASDVHFERTEGDMRVRFRIDGVLQEVAQVPRRMTSGAVSRMKIMAELDIGEKRLPQDGRVGLTVDGKRIDVRAVTVPTPRGEEMCLRILDRSNVLLSLDELGISGDSRERFEAAFRKPYGAVLVTGPTGSGKSTTLYGALGALSSVEKKIITIEDPVEYQIGGVNQIQVNVRSGLTFARGLRSMLRADPDVMMVGEIRDRETAQVAIEAALTGHMVLSTLHTNDAANAITRLTEMGVEPFLTASAVDCVVAQRLARRLCVHCRRPVTLTVTKLRSLGFDVADPIEGFEASTCQRCAHTGFKGRVGLYEVMGVSERIRELTVERSSGREIGRAAMEEGMKTLRQDGLDKVRSGMTSVDEILRVTF